MTASKLFIIGLCLLFFCALSVPRTQADGWNKTTQLTFSEPVEVPGCVLPAGTYSFSLVDSFLSDRDVVQIWNSDRTHLITTVLAISDYRLTPKGRTVIQFEEQSSGGPEALKAWFYPGDNYGVEFVYPRPNKP